MDCILYFTYLFILHILSIIGTGKKMSPQLRYHVFEGSGKSIGFNKGLYLSMSFSHFSQIFSPIISRGDPFRPDIVIRFLTRILLVHVGLSQTANISLYLIVTLMKTKSCHERGETWLKMRRINQAVETVCTMSFCCHAVVMLILSGLSLIGLQTSLL